MAIEPTKNKEKKPSMFQWLIVIFVSLLFALLVAVIILYAMGVDIGKHTKETLNKVPFIEDSITTDDEELHANKLAEKDEAINNLEEEKETIAFELQTKDKEIGELEEEISNLTTQITELEESQQGESVNTDSYKEMTESYATMKAETAATIIENMDSPIAISLLKELDAEVRGDILGEMNPETAASYTDQIINE